MSTKETLELGLKPDGLPTPSGSAVGARAAAWCPSPSSFLAFSPGRIDLIWSSPGYGSPSCLDRLACDVRFVARVIAC
jgi:hypothetical protein